MKAKLQVIKVSDDSLLSESTHPLSNILVDDDTKFETSVPCKHVVIYLNINDDFFKIDKIIVKNNGGNLVEVFGLEDENGSFDFNNGSCILPSSSMLKFHETKSRTKLNELYVFDKKQLNRAALVRQTEKDFNGWKKLYVKITQTFGEHPFGLQYFSIEDDDHTKEESNSSNNKMVDDVGSTPPIIKGATLDIPFLSDDDDDEPMISSGKNQLEEARKLAKTKLTLSPALNITPDIGSTAATAKPKKRTLPSGIAAKPQKKKDISDESEKSDKEVKTKKKTTKSTKTTTAAADKKRPKFKAISDSDNDQKGSASDTSSKKKKKAASDTKKPTKRKTTRKKKTLDDPSDTDDEEELIDNASDADENGNLAGFVVSNKTVIKDNKKLKDGPVCANKTEILQGCIVAISGIQNPKRTEIREVAMSMGAKYRPQYTSDTTHLIAAFVNDNNEKSKQAKEAGSFIVNSEWVFDCEKNSKKMNESKYSMIKDDASGSDGEFQDEDGGSSEDELSSSSDDLLGEEDREYRPKRKKRKVAAVEKRSTRSSSSVGRRRRPVVKKNSDDDDATNDDGDDGNESDKSLGKSSTGAMSQTSSSTTVVVPPPVVKQEIKPEVESNNTTIVTTTEKPKHMIETKAEEKSQDSGIVDQMVVDVPIALLSNADEQEVLRLKEFYDNNKYSKSFADFIVEDVFGLAYETTKDGDLFSFFGKWTLGTPSPKFIRMIARESVDNEDVGEVIKKLDECRDNILKYIEIKFPSTTNTKPQTDVKVDGPNQALPSFFEGCVFYIDRAVKGKQELIRYIVAYGGEVVTNFEQRKDDITHILVSSDYDGNTAYNDKVVVDVRFVLHSHKRKKKLNEEAYSAEY